MTIQQFQYAITIADCGSINEAAKQLYVSQPSLSHMIRELELELGITLFLRSNRGVTVTLDGEEFLGYARQMLEQFRLIEDRFVSPRDRKTKFSVSMQHYTFAVQAFIRVARAHGIDQFSFAIHETKTNQVIRHVETLKSEIGILYQSPFNREVLSKLFRDSGVEFLPLFECPVSVYLAKNHPLAGEEKLSLRQLTPYPFLSFDQGDSNSFHFSEEVLSTEDYGKLIKADDRATMLNLMVGLQGYTLCSGIICEDLNGDRYTAVPLDSGETMTLGYIKKKGMQLSALAEEFIAELQTFSPPETEFVI